MSRILTIAADETRDLLAAGRAVLIDVREADEFAREHIAGAHSMPLSRFKAGTLPHGEATTAIFHCASGRRTEQAADVLLASGFADVRCMDGGIDGWKKAGLQVAIDRKAPLPLQRQVLIAAGSLVVLGVVLAALLSVWFVLLSAGVGAGLVFAGATGMCGMARVLALMPWNRRAGAATATPAHAG